jgi:hypothetical protein
MRKGAAILLAIGTSLTIHRGVARAAAAMIIKVPRAGSATIDGRIGEREWRGAVARRLTDGSLLRLQHDGRSLYISITGMHRGYPSVCVGDRNAVHVFHASAALGRVTYSNAAATWTTSEREFSYGMRSPDLTDDARRERLTYLTDHGWVGSTTGMGDGRTHELQIAFATIPPSPALALAYWTSDTADHAILTWPGTLPRDDGCGDEQLVRGYLPTALAFKQESWAMLLFDP